MTYIVEEGIKVVGEVEPTISINSEEQVSNSEVEKMCWFRVSGRRKKCVKWLDLHNIT